MVADRAGTSGSCQALLMMMRVASPVGQRIARVGMRHLRRRLAFIPREEPITSAPYVT